MEPTGTLDSLVLGGTAWMMLLMTERAVGEKG